MAELNECLEAKVEQGRLKRKTVDRLKRDLVQARQAAEDARQAGNIVRQAEANRTANRRADRLRQLAKNLDIEDTFKDADENPDISATSVGVHFMDFDKQGRAAVDDNLVSAKERSRNAMFSQAPRFFTSAAPNVIGNVARDMKNVVRVMKGEQPRGEDPGAEELGKALQAAQEIGVRNFNAEGGRLPYDKFRGPAQRWSREKLKAQENRLGREQAKQQFADDIMPLLDREKMIDADTGLPMDDGKLRETLFNMFDKITHREEQITEGGIFPVRSISADRAQPRYLQFRDADSWLEGQRMYGAADSQNAIYDTIIGEFESLAEDTALLKVLGPMPDSGVRKIETEMKKRNARQPLFGSIRALYNDFTGKNNMPDRESVAQVGQFFRSTTNAAALGGAFISALTDLPMSIIAQAYSTGSITRGPLGIINRSIRQFAPGERSQRERRQAIRLNLGAGHLTNRINEQSRMMIDENQMMKGPAGVMQKVNQAVMRLSLLERWTTTMRHSFQVELLGEMTRNADRSFEEVPTLLRNTFNRHGIDAGDWDAIRARESMFQDPETGEVFIHPDNVAMSARSASAKLMNTITEEARFAVPTPGLKEKVGLEGGGTQAGTFWGEAIRTGTMLKSFPVTLTGLQLGGRTLEITRNFGWAPAAGYMTTLLGMTTAAGMISEQIDTVLDGQEPRPFNLRLAQDAMIRAGTLGILSDITFGNVSRFGLGSFLLGPAFDVIESGQRAGSTTISALFEAGVSDEGVAEALGDNNAGRNFLDFVDKVNPFGSLWYTQLAMERMLKEPLQRAVDPEAEQSFDRAKRWAEEQRNTDFFLPPGQGLEPLLEN